MTDLKTGIDDFSTPSFESLNLIFNKLQPQDEADWEVYKNLILRRDDPSDEALAKSEVAGLEGRGFYYYVRGPDEGT